MKSEIFLVVDDNQATLEITSATLTDAECPFELAYSTEEAESLLNENRNWSAVILRAHSDQIDGMRICNRIRTSLSVSQLPIFILLEEHARGDGAEFLIAGANDLLVGEFEPRELRIRANIIPADQRRRIDRAHSKVHQSAPQFHVPHFDPNSMRITFGKHQSRLAEWESSPTAQRVLLDTVIVCPECEAVPTFRHGCGACGSGCIEQEILIHHYACAHIGSEGEFRRSGELVCPKCRLSGLVAGSDFEQTHGCLRCCDCDAIFTESKMIGHCLSCQHRFDSTEGVVQQIFGFEIRTGAAALHVPAPNYLAGDQTKSVSAMIAQF